MKRVYIYRRFERFWHWTQTLLILFLALTGFEVHGTFDLFGFNKAVLLHNNAAYAYMIILVLIFFWLFITGEWRQYMPKRQQIVDQVEYYVKGIFQGAPHPTHKTLYHKFNPLQRATYFLLDFVILPTMVGTGVLYMAFYEFLKTGDGYAIRPIAYIHVAGAFILLVFVIVHVYLTTTGYKPMSAIKAMVTGWEEMSDDEAEVVVRENIRMAMSLSRKEIIDSGGIEDVKAFDDVLSRELSGSNAMMIDFQKKLLESKVGYFKIDANGIYIEVNNIWKDLYKETGINDPVGKHYHLNRSEEDIKAVDHIFKQIMNGKTITGVKLSRNMKDGSKKHHTISASPLYDKNKISGMEGYIIGIDD
jgi:thiosulfate reductase cytochrome b subunit